MKIVKMLLTITLLCCFSFAQCAKRPTRAARYGLFDLDATEEINMLDRQYNEPKEKEDETEIVLGAFANMVPSFVNIATNPHNPVNVINNLMQMIGCIVGTSIQLSKRLPEDGSIEEYQQLLNDLEECLKRQLRSLVVAKKAMLRKRAVR